jgi:multidrug resistance efflux pump
MLPRIPTPRRVLLREFRAQVVPALVFVLTLAAVSVVWHKHVGPVTLVGQVESLQERVASTKPGILSGLSVGSFQNVRSGQTVAHVITTDPEVLAASLALIQAEVHLLRFTAQTDADQNRYALSYDRARLDWMQQRVDLATAKVRLQLAENEFRRAEEMHREKIVADAVLDQARANWESLQAEVDERSRLVSEHEHNLERLRPQEDRVVFSTDEPDIPKTSLQATLRVQEKKLRLVEAELSPISLEAPMDGVVSVVHRRSGETVMAGEPILTISAKTSDRILAFLPQPIVFEPRVGEVVQIRSQARGRPSARATIVEVGSQMEPITVSPHVVPFVAVSSQVTGLPLRFSSPPELMLRPGERVDIELVAP